MQFVNLLLLWLQIPKVKEAGRCLALTAGITVWRIRSAEPSVGPCAQDDRPASPRTLTDSVFLTGSHLLRLVPARYWDGVYQPVHEPVQPNARALSRLLAGGPSGLPSARNRTVLSLFFGKYGGFHQT